MAVGDDMAEGRGSLLGLNSKEFGQDTSTRSPEDVAWADSCLTKDLEISETDWSSFTDALLETLTATQYGNSTYQEAEIPDGAKMEITSSDEEDTKDSNNLCEKDDTNPTSSGSFSYETIDDFWSKHNIEDVFLPTYNESLRASGDSDAELESVFPSLRLDQPTEDIFKVWDLGIPPEEHGLIKQLNKAIAGDHVETASVSEDLSAWKGLKDESLDDLISGISDLALDPNSG